MGKFCPPMWEIRLSSWKYFYLYTQQSSSPVQVLFSSLCFEASHATMLHLSCATPAMATTEKLALIWATKPSWEFRKDHSDKNSAFKRLVCKKSFKVLKNCYDAVIQKSWLFLFNFWQSNWYLSFPQTYKFWGISSWVSCYFVISKQRKNKKEGLAINCPKVSKLSRERAQFIPQKISLIKSQYQISFVWWSNRRLMSCWIKPN